MANPIDEAVQDWVVGHRSRWATSIAWKVTELGSTTVTAIGVVLIGLLLAVRARSWVPLAVCIAADLVTEITARTTKALVGRDRPPFAEAIEHLTNSAFPSGHVARAALLTTLAVLALPASWRRRGAIVATLVVGAVAWTRVYLGAHWLTDTLGAWPIGIGAALLARRAWRAWTPARADQELEPNSL